MSISYEYAARILLRYVAGGLGITGASNLVNDPDVVAMVAVALSALAGVVVEAWTNAARNAGRKV